jgi:hypothetical protein
VACTCASARRASEKTPNATMQARWSESCGGSTRAARGGSAPCMRARAETTPMAAVRRSRRRSLWQQQESSAHHAGVQHQHGAWLATWPRSQLGAPSEHQSRSQPPCASRFEIFDRVLTGAMLLGRPTRGARRRRRAGTSCPLFLFRLINTALCGEGRS